MSVTYLVMITMREALLGDRLIAIQRWRIGEPDEHRILRGILSGEATEESWSHVHTHGDELCEATG